MKSAINPPPGLRSLPHRHLETIGRPASKSTPLAVPAEVLVTGSSGLIGSEAVAYFDALGSNVLGVDNNMRAVFFGEDGDTSWNRKRLEFESKQFEHRDLDIRDREGVLRLFADRPVDLVVHCAAQPSHDLATRMPFEDFDVNAGGTLNLLEALRRHRPEAAFVLLSTNKVYGDAPNHRPLVELETRYDFADEADYAGVGENWPVDQVMHSLFGASKLAADVMAQEYGRYFGLNVGVFRGGCLTGPRHGAVELHGFLSYLVKAAVTGTTYRINGYKGKQVRDNIHCHDVLRAIHRFAQDPKPGEVYNIGGGRANSCSILEAASLVEEMGGPKLKTTYSKEARLGDHICYITDLTKLKNHFPGWDISIPLRDTIAQLIKDWKDRH